ncbi:hypothetical protein ZOSMA_214G00040 [Zostera marina]|uniref:Uncharacterized protein n=1 Tax=Zostera marina TaxID=29655 RepID=A0A0K9PKB4_ZOSMR|nr:hypothetical protein ZOSMA_214G00040 [Zostera marina]
MREIGLVMFSWKVISYFYVCFCLSYSEWASSWASNPDGDIDDLVASILQLHLPTTHRF